MIIQRAIMQFYKTNDESEVVVTLVFLENAETTSVGLFNSYFGGATFDAELFFDRHKSVVLLVLDVVSHLVRIRM